jgi:hypothetical protein
VVLSVKLSKQSRQISIELEGPYAQLLQKGVIQGKHELFPESKKPKPH